MFVSRLIFLISFILVCTSCKEKTKSYIGRQDVAYEHKGAPMMGYLSHKLQKTKEKLPGVLVIHDWVGLSDYTKERTDMVSELGYVTFAMDMYGKGVRAKNHKEAGELMTNYVEQPELLISRIQAALEILKAQENVDPNKIAIIGYCFGGYAALKFAYTGKKIQGVVAFHPTITVPTPQEAKQVATPLLVHHGEKDPLIKPESLKSFQETLKQNKVDLRLTIHPNTLHAFTKKSVDDENLPAARYNKVADEKSWKSMEGFLQEIFSK